MFFVASYFERKLLELLYTNSSLIPGIYVNAIRLTSSFFITLFGLKCIEHSSLFIKLECFLTKILIKNFLKPLTSAVKDLVVFFLYSKTDQSCLHNL